MREGLEDERERAEEGEKDGCKREKREREGDIMIEREKEKKKMEEKDGCKREKRKRER